MYNLTREHPKLIEDHVVTILIFTNWVFGCGIISLFGVITNAINIVIFLRLGLKDTVNISLLGLAIADLCGLVFLILISIFYNPLFYELDLPFNAPEVEYLAFGWPRLIFTRTTSWITALVTFERCLCVTFPLKVKTLITPRRVGCAVLAIYFIMACSITPTYYSNLLGWKFDVERNKTVFGLIYRKERRAVDGVSFIVGVLITSVSYIFVVACSLVLVFSLKRQTKKFSTMVGQSSESTGAVNKDVVDSRTAKSRQVTKMILVLSIVFIVCYIPSNLVQLGMALVKDFNKGGRYANTHVVAWTIVHVMEASNSSRDRSYKKVNGLQIPLSETRL
ncbi:blue-sensitive opsin-like [Aplysia californica]|uniref:Blue-sensitive opsin-like n=1 Tax=Aplysia californica TaxID=6500 RepID=A0ABM0JH18_APLCA|nr:blue-sensitive opsin-like [Aplysia californica]